MTQAWVSFNQLEISLKYLERCCSKHHLGNILFKYNKARQTKEKSCCSSVEWNRLQPTPWAPSRLWPLGLYHWWGKGAESPFAIERKGLCTLAAYDLECWAGVTLRTNLLYSSWHLLALSLLLQKSPCRRWVRPTHFPITKARRSETMGAKVMLCLGVIQLWFMPGLLIHSVMYLSIEFARSGQNKISRQAPLTSSTYL